MPGDDDAAAKAAADKAAADKAAADKIAADKAKADDAHLVEKDGERLYKEKHVKDLRGEAQKNRERAEAAETKLREKEAAEEAALQQKLKDEKNFEELAESERKKREKSEKDAADKVTAVERRAIKAEVKALAIVAGLIDPDDVDLIDLSSVTIDKDDKIVGAEKVVEAFKEAKPHKFSDEKRSGGLSTDKPGSGGSKGDIDARQMKPEQFADLDRRMRAGK